MQPVYSKPEPYSLSKDRETLQVPTTLQGSLQRHTMYFQKMFQYASMPPSKHSISIAYSILAKK